MDATDIANNSDNVLVFIWKYFLYNYFNGWFILIISLFIAYFIILRYRYQLEEEIHNSKKLKIENYENLNIEHNNNNINNNNNNNNKNKNSNVLMNQSSSNNELIKSLSSEIRTRIDLAVLQSADEIYNMVIGYINSLDYSQSNNRRVDITHRKLELLPKIQTILQQQSSKLYAELPKKEGYELRKYKIQKLLERYVPRKIYLNLKSQKADIEHKTKEYDKLRNTLANYGSSKNANSNELKNLTNQIKSLRNEIEIHNQIFNLLITSNLFEEEDTEKTANDKELLALYQRTAKEIEEFVNSGFIGETENIEPVKDKYKYDARSAYDGYYLNEIKLKEKDQTKKFGKAYQDYLKKLEEDESKINPVELLSKVENNIIKFLETIKDGNTTIADDIKNSKMDAINPVNITTDTIGNYLLDKNTQAELIEGFEEPKNLTASKITTSSTGSTNITNPNIIRPAITSSKTKKNNKQNRKNDMISSLLEYGYELLSSGYQKITGDTYLVDKLEKITQDNEQMMTVGFLFILVSVVLLMIEFTS